MVRFPGVEYMLFDSLLNEQEPMVDSDPKG